MPFRFVAPLVLLASALSVQAVQDAAGTACTGTGACTYQYVDTDGVTVVTVNGFCAPDGFCADDGATCTTNDNCYNYCGSDGLCGGLAAYCDTTAATGHGEFDVTCFTPTYTCNIASNAASGSCGLAASQGARVKRDNKERARQHERKTRDLRLQQELSSSRCPLKGYTACAVETGGFECIDTMNSLEQCGGCSENTGAVDCTALAHVAEVSCLQGRCIVDACDSGYTLHRGQCI